MADRLDVGRRPQRQSVLYLAATHLTEAVDSRGAPFAPGCAGSPRAAGGIFSFAADVGGSKLGQSHHLSADGCGFMQMTRSFRGRFRYSFLKVQAMLLLAFGRPAAALARFDQMASGWPLDRYALASRAHVLAGLNRQSVHHQPTASRRPSGFPKRRGRWTGSIWVICSNTRAAMMKPDLHLKKLPNSIPRWIGPGMVWPWC